MENKSYNDDKSISSSQYILYNVSNGLAINNDPDQPEEFDEDEDEIHLPITRKYYLNGDTTREWS